MIAVRRCAGGAAEATGSEVTGFQKAAGESPTVTKDTHRPGQAPALGLRAGNAGAVIVSQAISLQENNRATFFMAARPDR
jgi:hypothetical protein